MRAPAESELSPTGPTQDKPLTYADAGVDTARGMRAVEAIRADVQSTYRNEVIGDIGGFGGLFSIAAAKDMKDPVLVSGSDGVGTKLELARQMGIHNTVGIDLVAMCVNDIAVTGAEPLFFLDYIALETAEPDFVREVVSGIAEGCRQAGCALIGGETAEHPGIMAAGDYDLSGFCVGVVDRPRIIDGSTVTPGDVVLGIASSGLHSNGYSLVRHAVVDPNPEALAGAYSAEDTRTLGEALLAPTRIYTRTALELARQCTGLKAMAHITGGGITENLDRVLPKNCNAVVTRGSWKIPPVIEHVVKTAQLTVDESLKTFNMGIGFAVVVDSSGADSARAIAEKCGETVFEIGRISAGTGIVMYEDASSFPSDAPMAGTDGDAGQKDFV